MTEQSYLELFAALDKATEPSRDLDAAIWRMLPPDGGDRTNPYNAPRFTRSIDAALMLMRKHYLWQLKQGIECTAIVWWLEKDWDDTGAPTAYSTTYPALALAKAALLARAVEDRVTSTVSATDKP